MKKKIIIFAACICLNAALYAQDRWLSFGTTLNFETSLFFNNGGVGFDFMSKNETTEKYSEFAGIFDTTSLDFNVYAFADLKYALLQFGTSKGMIVASADYSTTNGGAPAMKKASGDFTSLDLTLLGKFPIYIRRDRIAFMPLAGINYQIVCDVKDSGGKKLDNPSDLSMLWFQFGAAMEFGIGEHLYIRPQILYSIRPASKYEQDFMDAINSMPEGSAEYALQKKGLIGVSVGWKV
ncbi:MAG: hypothetical protein LBC27_09700 [Spirochaetaceae bacterium]|jgi:hypothetical protein|nr:hypothetical protein [Spirochaetaceae bacterium]